ncbi:MAG: hypothetical protein R6W48_09660 [Gaiellaceae bacterium]
MRRGEREAIMRQGVVLPETPRDRRERAALDEDIRAMPIAGAPVPLRLRNFSPRADAYLAASRGPLPYMVRLHEIERRSAELEESCGEAWRSLAEKESGREAFARDWKAWVESLGFDELDDLIDRHNRWYPIEARLPMDPATGEYVLVNGRDYRLPHLDVDWVLERFPPRLGEAAASSAARL